MCWKNHRLCGQKVEESNEFSGNRTKAVKHVDIYTVKKESHGDHLMICELCRRVAYPPTHQRLININSG